MHVTAACVKLFDAVSLKNSSFYVRTGAGIDNFAIIYVLLAGGFRPVQEPPESQTCIFDPK